MNKRNEKISAFLDNDMHCDELMSFSLSAESDDAKIAQRYQMMGDALRGEISGSSFVDVSHAVREALANENIGDEISAAKSESLSDPFSDKRGGFIALPSWLLAPRSDRGRPSLDIKVSTWFRPAAGMAVAASVAVVMVVTLSGQQTGTLAPVAANIESQLEAQPVVRVAVDDKAITDKTMDNKVTDIDQRLFNQHLEFAQDTLQGRSRAVSFESKK